MCLDNDIALEEQVVQMGDWAALKASTPLGQLPVFHDGKLEIGQSNAILRYVARKHGLYGKNDNEATLIDMLNDQQEDVRISYLNLIYRQYDTEKDNYIKALPAQLAAFEKFLKRNNEGTGFFVGNQISFVDYTIFDLVDNLLILSPSCLDTYPLLKAFHGRIATHEKLARYRQTDGFKKLPINGNGKQ